MAEKRPTSLIINEADRELVRNYAATILALDESLPTLDPEGQEVAIRAIRYVAKQLAIVMNRSITNA